MRERDNTNAEYVELYVAGRVFKEQVYARNYDEAKQVALARNPNARVVSVTAVL